MEDKSLESVIRQYIHLPALPTSGGWYPVLCKVCNDHGRKGPRGGFKFDGETVAYHCFNCGPEMNTVYDPNKEARLPKKMKIVMHDYGIPDEAWQQVTFSNLGKQGKLTKDDELQPAKNIEPIELPLPDIFYPLADATKDDKWAEIARWYLTEERGVDPDSYPFMLVKPTKDPKLKKWYGRLIIPIYKDNKLIFYYGRDLIGNKTKKYESPPTPKDRVMYGFDQLFEHTDAPIYIVEGWFDAYAIDGVAIFGNEITDAQTAWLNKSRRKKVYIPDRLGDGKRAAEDALEQGWSISTPDIGQSCKDMSDAVHKYGKMYVMKTIAENTAAGFAAQTKLGVYCESDGGKGKNTKSPREKR